MTDETNYSNSKIINTVNQMKEEIERVRPLSQEIEARIFQKFRLDWNYNSCVIEGNSLNYGETVSFLMSGLTAKGKPLKDHLDIKGHNEAIIFLLDMVKNSQNFTEMDIRSLHKMILVEPYEIDAITPDGQPTKKLVKLGVYKNSPNHVKTLTGEIHYYPTPEETPIKMNELLEWYRKLETDKDVHPVILAALFHYKFVSIHPFDDGNGRMARLLMNLILLKNSYPPVVIKQQNKNQYYSFLSQADANYPLPFIEFICENLIHSMEIYIKGAKGESIDEPEDFDKELTLLKQTVAGREDKLEFKRTLEIQKELYSQSIKPFILQLGMKLDKLNDLFLIHERFGITISSDNEYTYNHLYFGSYSVMKNMMINETSGSLEKIICNSIDYNSIIISFSFDEFKTEKSPFGTEVKISFELEEYKYRILYSISEYKELKGKNADVYKLRNWKILSENYYHQQLSESEIKSYCDDIGKNTLAYIKEHIDNPDAHLISISDENLETIWNGFIREIFRNNTLDILNVSTPTFDYSRQTIFIKISCSNDTERLMERFPIYVIKKLNITRNIGFKIINRPGNYNTKHSVFNLP